MKKLQPLPKLTTKQAFFSIGSITTLSLGNIFHFTYEFSILQKVNLPYFFIIFHMIGVFFGAIFVLEVLHKKDSIAVFLIQFILLIFFLISLMIFLQHYTPFWVIWCWILYWNEWWSCLHKYHPFCPRNERSKISREVI